MGFLLALRCTGRSSRIWYEAGAEDRSNWHYCLARLSAKFTSACTAAALAVMVALPPDK